LNLIVSEQVGGVMNINNLFDINKDFVLGVIEYVGETELPDYLFSQACDEYDIDESKAMELLMESSDYEFLRIPEGWIINAR